jgi:hypothetical protein
MKFIYTLLFTTIAACCFAKPIAPKAKTHSAATGTKYYVATPVKGGSDNNAGTSLNMPFASIAKAITAATHPGDAIYVRSGTYPMTATVNISTAGTAENHMILSIYKPDLTSAAARPIFDFSAMPMNNNNKGFNLSAASYWDIYGIVIKGAGDNGMYITNHTGFTTITFCDFIRNKDTGLQMAGGAHDLLITNCDSFENADIGEGSRADGGNADGFSPKMDVGNNIRFKGCRAWGNSDDGWDGYVRGAANDMTTYLEDCWTFRNGWYWKDHSTNRDMNGNGFKMGGSDAKDKAHNFVLVKCLSFDNKAKGFDQNNNAGSIYLYNCTGFRNQIYDFGFNMPSPNARIKYKPGAELVLVNNLSLGTKGVQIPAESNAERKLVMQNNSFLTIESSPEILSTDTTGVTAMRGKDGSLPTLKFMHLNKAAAQHTYIGKGIPVADVEYHGAKGIPFKGKPNLGAFDAN